MLRETAFERVRLAMGEPDADGVADAVVAAGKELLKHGVTSTVEAGVGRPEELRAYQRLRDNGRLPVRTYLMMMIDEMLDDMVALGIRTGFGDEWLRIGPAKLFSDGTIGGRTARMRVPYEGQAENVGLWMMPPAELKEKVLRAHASGFQVGIHAIGDAAIDLVLDAYEEAMRRRPATRTRATGSSTARSSTRQRSGASRASAGRHRRDIVPALLPRCLHPEPRGGAPPLRLRHGVVRPPRASSPPPAPTRPSSRSAPRSACRR